MRNTEENTFMCETLGKILFIFDTDKTLLYEKYWEKHLYM